MKSSEHEFGINPEYLPSESLWQAFEELLPVEPLKLLGGRPRQSDRQLFFAIFYVLRTGIHWKALPRSLGAPSTAHDRFQQWVRAGVFHAFWQHELWYSYQLDRLDFSWQSIDSCLTKAPLGGQHTGPNPTDRGKSGTKRHLLTDTAGLPIGLVVTGAERHDKTQVQAVLGSRPFIPPPKEQDQAPHFCADKGYDFRDVRQLIDKQGYIEHIKSRGDEKQALKTPGYRARRWVNERTHSWMNRFRRILIRWEKKVDNYLAFLYLVCAFIILRHADQVFG